MSVNIFIAMGNISRDMELRYTPKGTAVCDNSLALNRTWTNEVGEKMEEVAFVDFVAFGRTAEVISQYFKKGSMIHLTGYIKQETWQDKQTGANRSKLKMMVERFAFCGGGKSQEKEQEDKPARPAPRRMARAAVETAPDGAQPDGDEDNVPF